MKSQAFLYPPGIADDLQDLQITCTSRGLEFVQRGGASLRGAGRGPADPLTRRLRAAARDALREFREHGKLLTKGLEQAYLNHRRELEGLAEGQARQQALVRDFQDRLVYVGSDEVPRCWGHLGWVEDNPAWPVALTRDRGLCGLVAGVQGSGKTLFSSLIAEGSQHPGPPLCSPGILPTAHVFFHIEEHDRLPQLLDGLKPNPDKRDLDLLLSRLGVHGRGLHRVRIAVHPDLMEHVRPRLAPYLDLGLEVVELKVRPGQLGQAALEAALEADGTRLVKRMLQHAQVLGRDLTITEMQRFIDEAEDLSATQKASARARLQPLAGIASPPDGPGLWQLFEPGVITIVYLGGPHMVRAHVAPILVALMDGLLMPSDEHGEFHRVIVVDEVNLLAEDPVAWRVFTRVARLVRHRGVTLLLMGQDLNCVPDELFGLAGFCAVFQLANPRIWEHVRDRVGALRRWRFGDVEGLRPGEALLAARVTTDPRWQQGARLVRMRPLQCEHGGRTRSVV